MTVGGRGYDQGMDGMTTARDLDAMTPADRQAAFDASIVLDPTALSERYQAMLFRQDDEVRERYRRQAS